MSCYIYCYEGKKIMFVDNDKGIPCLCCFPDNYEDNKKITSDHVKAMACLGAAIAMIKNRKDIGDELSYVYLPNDLPHWIIEEINRLIPDNED